MNRQDTIALDLPNETKAQSTYATKPFDIETLPPGIPYIVGNEAAERFSFYGMKAILMVFMTTYLMNAAGELAPMGTVEARRWVHGFVTAVYFFPIIGAVLSDWLFGKYNTILWLSIVYCAGHAVMALVDLPHLTHVEPRIMLFIALALIAVGSGGIKPCVSSHVGDQFGVKNQHLMSKVFQWFYFSINLGSAISTLMIPVVLEHFGPPLAFGIPGILMGIATLVFWMGRKKFVHIPPAGRVFFQETFSRIGLRAIFNLIPLYMFVAMFWALFDQTASSWVVQAQSMDRWIWGYEILPSQLQALNPLLVMLFIPLFSFLIYPFFEKRTQVTPLRKIGCGLFLTVIAFAIPAWVEMRIAAGETPHMVWHLVAYIVLTAAEILISITALEFSYTQAPKRMKSFIMGLFLLSVSFGNFFTAAVNFVIKDSNGERILNEVEYYWFFTGCMLLAAVVYVFWARLYKGQTFIQGDDTP